MGRGMRDLSAEGVGSFLLQMTEKQVLFEDGARNFIVEKWHEFLHLLQNLPQWLVVGFWVLIVAVILLITVPILVCCLQAFCLCLFNLIVAVGTAIFSCVAFICSCFVRLITMVAILIWTLAKSFVTCLRGCFPCFASAGGTMMRAPGRAGEWILRATFESNPAAYFRLLRA